MQFSIRSVLTNGIAAVLLVIPIVTSSHPLTGDAREYLLMAHRLMQGRSPDVSVEHAQIAGVYEPRLINARGQQEMWHFWFFPLCAVPVMVITTWMNASPVVAFGAFNAILLWIAFIIVRRRSGTWSAIFVCLSPIIWWTDKAQVEVFTFFWLVMGFMAVHRLPWAALCFAVAATQQPPIGALVLVTGAAAILRQEMHLSDVWLWALVVVVVVLHPLYYWVHLGRLTPLVEASDVRIPGVRAFITPLIDLNVGLLVNAPVIAFAFSAAIVASALVVSERKPTVLVLAAYLIFLFAFAQAPNVNSGGTPGMTRYALWFIPPCVALLDHASSRLRRRGFAAVTFGSAAWSVLFFRPSLPEQYLWPTPVAAAVWSRYPAFENPLPEIFAERLRHKDGVNTLASTPNCGKALVQGGQWPDPCAPVGPVPPACSSDGALCYANRRSDGRYDFVLTSRRGGVRLAEIFWR